jgi:hypothetical protein
MGLFRSIADKKHDDTLVSTAAGCFGHRGKLFSASNCSVGRKDYNPVLQFIDYLKTKCHDQGTS